jgi:hypothetical protein
MTLTTKCCHNDDNDSLDNDDDDDDDAGPGFNNWSAWSSFWSPNEFRKSFSVATQYPTLLHGAMRAISRSHNPNENVRFIDLLNNSHAGGERKRDGRFGTSCVFEYLLWDCAIECNCLPASAKII